jgi:hypothetical protein
LQQAPWCIDVSGMPWGANCKLYVARAVTDLRTTTLENGIPEHARAPPVVELFSRH